jgi:hypothetical protein
VAGLVWRLGCGDAGHALVCLVVSVLPLVWATIWDAVVGGNGWWRGEGCGVLGAGAWMQVLDYDTDMTRKWQRKMLVFSVRLA